MIFEVKKEKLGHIIKTLYNEKIFVLYRSLMLEQITGKDVTDAIQLVAPAAKSGAARAELRRSGSPAAVVASEIMNVPGVAATISNRVSPDKEIDDKMVGDILLRIFKQKREQPDRSMQDMFSANYGFNLPDTDLEVFDETIVSQIIGNLENALRNVQVVPEAPIEMSIPHLGDLFDQVRTEITGLTPIGE